MEFKLLGPVEVRNRGSVMPMGGAKQRALLALLLLHANETVSRDRLIDELWGEVWTPSAGHRLETHISRLRKTLELNGKLVSDRGGYVLEVDPMLIDTHLFERLLEEGRREAAAGHTADAAQTLREALSLWRGGALADLAYEPFARSEIERLEELRVAAIEERVDLDLALGRHREVVAELDALT
ncbi:MAG TPA: AfsR/SARP family transcriptional regulator, partial [Solirubrobacteraceae bacterium]|nr:AfsR/SARP family transcriptional regulator [Solirubrobacteraceae bacterium]